MNEYVHPDLDVAASAIVAAGKPLYPAGNRDSAAHTVTADDTSFDSGALQSAASFTQTFAKAGTFAYHCSIHSRMVGTIVVH